MKTLRPTDPSIRPDSDPDSAMTRRRALLTVAGLSAFALPALSLRSSAAANDGADWKPLELSKQRWKEILEPAAYRVLRQEGTERAFTSPLNNEKRDGLFLCAGCNLPLFESDKKYDSGTGWPSFWAPIKGAIATKRDFKLVVPRTEYHCARCGGHQGHVFGDGPRPTGKRYCNNGVALSFVPKGEELPPLRQS